MRLKKPRTIFKKPKDILVELVCIFCPVWGVIYAYRWFVGPRHIADLWFLASDGVIFLIALTILLFLSVQAKKRNDE